MPTKPTRSVTLPLRLSPAEKATLDERAAAAGLKVSEYLRREAGIGRFGRADLRRVGKPKPTLRREPPELGPDYELRVRKLALRMPRKTAERLVRREMEAEAAA